MRHERIIHPGRDSLAPRKGCGVTATCLLLAAAIAILATVALLKGG